jgi:hypothetical protein
MDAPTPAEVIRILERYDRDRVWDSEIRMDGMYEWVGRLACEPRAGQAAEETAAWSRVLLLFQAVLGHGSRSDAPASR